MVGYLSRLLRYAPTANRSAREDFLTEAFAGLLERCAPLLDECWRIGRERGRLNRDLPTAGAPAQIATQYDLGQYGRVDLAVLVDREPCILCEVKLWAAFTEGGAADAGEAGREHQVARYAKYVRGRAQSATVLVLSPVERPDIPEEVRRDPAFVGNLLWPDVYDAAERIRPQIGDQAGVLLDEFRRLLEDMGMKPHAPLRPADGARYWEYVDWKARLASLLERSVALANGGAGGSVRVFRGDSYVYCELACGPTFVDVGLITGKRGDPRGLWPVLHVRRSTPQPLRTRLEEALAARASDIDGGAWTGACAYPNDKEMDAFLGAADSETQAALLGAIIRGWIDRMLAAVRGGTADVTRAAAAAQNGSTNEVTRRRDG